MLKSLDLQSLQDRRKEKRLCFLYSIQKGKVPAINTNEYLTPIKSKRRIKAKHFSDCVTENIIKRHQNLNNKSFQLPESSNIVYKNSFFPKSISEWNELPESVVNAPSVETFKSRLKNL